MSKAVCRDKRAYTSQEEAAALSLPGTKTYLCPSCGLFHATSKQSAGKNRARFEQYKRRKWK